MSSDALDKLTLDELLRRYVRVSKARYALACGFVARKTANEKSWEHFRADTNAVELALQDAEDMLSRELHKRTKRAARESKAKVLKLAKGGG